MMIHERKTALLAEARAILEAAKGADRAMSAEETVAFDAKMAEVDTLEQTIERERKLEAASVVVPSSRSTLPAHQFEPVTNRVEVVERKREPGESLGVLVRALRQFGADKTASLGWAEREFGAQSPEYRALGWTDFTAGGATVPDQFSSEIIPLLQNASAFRKAGAVVVPLRGTLDIPAMTGGVTAYWLGENTDITPSEGTFGQKRLIEKTLAALTPISNDLLRLGTPSVDRLIRDNIVTALANAEDLAFFKGTGTAFTPRGIYYQMDTAHNTATAGTALANIRTDIQDAVNFLAADNVPNVRRAFFFNPRTVNYMKWSMVDANSNFAFPDLRANNTLNGWPVFETNNITTATNVEWYLVEMSAIYIGDGPGLELKVVDGAAWDNSGTVVAGFSRDQSVIRAIKKVDMVMAYSAAAVCTNTVTV